MLRDLLEIIWKGPYTVAELARQLDTSEGLVFQMLDDLEQMGRLTHANRAAGGVCAFCPLNKVCCAETCASTATRAKFRLKAED